MCESVTEFSEVLPPPTSWSVRVRGVVWWYHLMLVVSTLLLHPILSSPFFWMLWMNAAWKPQASILLEVDLSVCPETSNYYCWLGAGFNCYRWLIPGFNCYTVGLVLASTATAGLVLASTATVALVLASTATVGLALASTLIKRGAKLCHREQSEWYKPASAALHGPPQSLENWQH